MMRILVAIAFVSFSTSPLFAQREKVKVDSIAFHLYTDSLKKGGVYNYINVDGKMSNGRWLPLSAEDLNFTSSGGKFDGCNLYFDSTFNADSVVVKAILKTDTSLHRSITIYIKKLPDDEVLKTMEEVMQPSGKQPARKRRRG